MKDGHKGKHGHKRGIGKVSGADKELKKGEAGKMHAKEKKGGFKRTGGSLTPRRG